MATADEVRSRPVPMPPSGGGPVAPGRGAIRAVRPGPGGVRGGVRGSVRGGGPPTTAPRLPPSRGGGAPPIRTRGPESPPQQIQARCPKCQTQNLFPEATIPRIACYECDTPIDSPLFARPSPAPSSPSPSLSSPPSSPSGPPQLQPRPAMPNGPKPSLNPPPQSASAPAVSAPHAAELSHTDSVSKLQISGPIKVKHTTAQDLLNSLDPKGTPTLKASAVPTGQKPKRKTSLMKGFAVGIPGLKKGKKPAPAPAPEAHSPRPVVSSPMNVSKTTEAPASSLLEALRDPAPPSAAAEPPFSSVLPVPPPVEDLPVPEVPVRKPYVPLSPRTVQPAPPAVPAHQQSPPRAPAAVPAHASEVEAAQKRLRDCEEQAEQLRSEAQRIQQRLAETEGAIARARQELDEALERQRVAEQERLERERLEQERLEQERLERERQEQIRLEQERLEMERLEEEKRERLRLENERLERERLERIERERIEREHSEQLRIAAEKQAAEEKQRREIEARDRAEADRLAQEHADADDGEEDYDESQLMDCPECKQPNIFPTGCFRIACWNCNSPMNMTPPAADPAPPPQQQQPAPPPSPAPTAQQPHPEPAPVDDQNDDDDSNLDGLPEAVCLQCQELNYLPHGAPRVACWNCGQVVDAPVASEVVRSQPDESAAAEEADYDDELLADCPDCGEPNIFPEGAPRIACWSCEKPIDRPN